MNIRVPLGVSKAETRTHAHPLGHRIPDVTGHCLSAGTAWTGALAGWQLEGPAHGRLAIEPEHQEGEQCRAPDHPHRAQQAQQGGR